MKYILILAVFLFIGCGKKDLIPSCISDKGSTFVFVSADSKKTTNLNTTVKCL